jgi:hypothetical protein
MTRLDRAGGDDMAGSKIVFTRAKMRHLPARLATGSYILDAGLGKLKESDEETAKRVHHLAAETYPFLADVDPGTFLRALGAAEVVLGGSLLAPFVPSWLVGLGLAGFSGGLLNLYLHSPRMRREGSVRPSPEGKALAKDVWMLGIALSLLLDSGSWSRRRR